MLDRYRQYLEGLQANDVDAVLEPLHDGVASAIRDYVGETGTLIELTGKDAHRDWYAELLATLRGTFSPIRSNSSPPSGTCSVSCGSKQNGETADALVAFNTASST